MRKKTGKKTTGKIFKRFWVLLLVFALIIPSMNGITVQAHADDTASVWKIYATVSGEDFTDLELVTASEPVEGKELIAKFITDGTYTLTEEDRDKTIIADNAELTAGDFNVDALKLSGTSSLIYPDYILSSTEERFRSYSASGAAITLEGLEAHYDAYGTPYYVGPDLDSDDPNAYLWGTSYDFTVSGNTTIAGFPDKDEEGNEWISPYWIGYNDTVVTSTGNISIEEGGHLIIEGTLTVEDGGKITGSGDDHYLRVCEGAVVTGLPLYAETPDNDVSNFFSNPNHGEYEFRYDSETGKWICPFDPEWPVFYFNVGGLKFSDNENENESIELKYKYSEEDSYIVADPVVTYDDGMTVGYGISLKEIPETADKIYLQLTFFPAAESTKTIVCWATMDNEFDFRYEDISGYTLEHVFRIDDVVNVSLGYLNSGNPEITDTANDYLYAYTGTDDEIKGYLATELYRRFIEVPMFENFGLGNAEDLASRIEMTGSLGDINAIDKDGTSVTIPVNNYKVSWGYNMDNGDPVESNIPVYTLPDAESFLICTDFNKDNGTGETFYIRKAHADEVPFDGTAQEAIPVVVSSINPETIVIGGMGADTTVQNSDNVYAFNLNSRWLNQNFNGPSQPTDPADYGTIVRIMIGSETYVMLTGDGETKNYGGIGNNGFGTDTIWNTSADGDAEASVYIGLSTLYIRPLAEETGVSVREITSVELADESLAAGVHIVTKDNGDIEITFDSNFYATIPLNITYSDGKTRQLTINRVGLVIQYGYLSGDPNEDHDTPDHLDMGFDHREGTIGLDYDYFAGEQIAVYGIYYTPTNDPTGNSSDLSLYMTFDDGTHRVITAENNDILTLSGGGEVNRGFDGRMAATNDSVATTVFLIGFAEAKTFDGILWIGNITDTYYTYNGNKGFYANVLNAGWDDDDNFGGTQVGSGKGIYWDGHITWY